MAMDFIDAAFELLGHTGKNYVSNQDYIDFKTFSNYEKDEDKMLYIANVLVDSCLRKVLSLEIDDYFTGVQVGLETHRRKNVGGTSFSTIIDYELTRIIKKIKLKGYEVKLTKEEVIYYTDSQTSKTLDFCLRYGGKNSWY